MNLATLNTLTPAQTAATDKVRALRDSLATAFYERKDEATCIALALLAREHVLLLGPPGTGKSAITQAAAKAIGGAYFERLMTAFTVPEELFGPYSIQGLQEDRYERKVDGYLPTATVGFLDEIFKAGSPILNALLTILNERDFDSGSTRMHCPLEICIGASNELPAEGLDALADRFVLRRWVQPIKDRDARRALLATRGEPAVAVRLTPEDLAEARAAAAAVQVPDAVTEALLDLHDALGTELGMYVSDRRLRKMVKLVRAHAALCGRAVAQLDDLLVLTDAIWQKPEERPAVHALVCRTVAPALAEALKVLDAATELMGKVPEAGLANVQGLANANTQLQQMVATVKGMAEGSERVLEIAARIEAMADDVARKVSASLGRRR